MVLGSGYGHAVSYLLVTPELTRMRHTINFKLTGDYGRRVEGAHNEDTKSDSTEKASPTRSDGDPAAVTRAYKELAAPLSD